MAGNTFGSLFSLTTFGESHGPAIGGVLDGCPAGLKLDVDAVQHALDRRKPGQSRITTQRKEPDTVEFLSGIFEGVTTGTPIGFVIRNADQRSRDYSHIQHSFRPSHADYTYQAKYGLRDYRGGGRSSARETASRVVAGDIARQLLASLGVSGNVWVHRVQDIAIPKGAALDFATQEENLIRCPHPDTAAAMTAHIDAIRKAGDTVGGEIRASYTGVPAGWGEPVFEKLHATLGGAMLGINAVKGFEIGSGYRGTYLKGSEHNDAFVQEGDTVRTTTNHSGGIQGGISNGEPIEFSVAFKPVATIMQDQPSVNDRGEEVTVKGKGRHDPCVLPRAVPIVEAMACLTLADFALRARASKL